MTPAERAGLKVGDKIRVLSVSSVYSKGGDVLVFSRDDKSNCPWFKHDNPDNNTRHIDELAEALSGIKPVEENVR